MDKISALLLNPPEKIKGKIVAGLVILDVTEEHVHYWSPQLNFRVDEDENDPNASIVSGLIGPRPAVWSLFMFIYFSMGFIGFFISSFGVSKLILGEYSPYILAFPIAILFMLTAYKAGKYGEQLGKDQIEILKQFVRSVTEFEH